MDAIIFDFDGVIHNTFDITWSIYKKINPKGSKESYRSLFDGNLFNTLDREEDKTKQEIFRKLESEAFKFLKLERKIKKELEVLNKSYDLFIISSNTKKNLKMYFENNNFTHIFKEILSSDTHKSKIEKFRILFNKYSLDSKSCIFITDTLGDILEAKKVGVRSIAVDFGFHDRGRLQKGNPLKIISNFKEIRKIIQEL